MGNQTLLDEMRSLLRPLNRDILNHPYILEAEKGLLALKRINAFVLNQYYIINNDAKSLALMVSRSKRRNEFEFFNAIQRGDTEAVSLLVNMAEALDLKEDDLEESTPIPQAVVYAHYLTALAHFSSPGEQAMALTVNLPVWGSNCRRLSAALRERYGITETAFLDLFANPMAEVEEEALSIINGYLNKEREMRKAAKFIQAYELMFWEGIYRT